MEAREAWLALSSGEGSTLEDDRVACLIVSFIWQ